MEYGICLQSIIPVRAEASHRSELVTQLLFGELYEITERNATWCRIRISHDGYEGWIDSQQSTLIEEEEHLRLSNAPVSVSLDLVQLLSDETMRSLKPVVLGSSLPGLDESRFTINGHLYFFDGVVSQPLPNDPSSILSDQRKTRQQLADDAMLYLHSPYLWGGRTPFGIDCSGFTQMICRLQGISLLRDASQQATQGDVVSLLEEASTGDLAFFDDEEGKIIHVGMILDNQRIIHCSGQVRIDNLDHQGIYNSTLQKYTHALRLIRTILDA